VILFIVSAPARRIALPTAVEPVKEIFATSGWLVISVPTRRQAAVYLDIHKLGFGIFFINERRQAGPKLVGPIFYHLSAGNILWRKILPRYFFINIREYF